MLTPPDQPLIWAEFSVFTTDMILDAIIIISGERRITLCMQHPFVCQTYVWLAYICQAYETA